MASLHRKLTVAGVSLVGTLGALEVGLRVAGYDPFGERMSTGRQEPGELLSQGFLIESEDPDLIYELAPGGRAFAWGADVELNSQGFRDGEYALAKPAGTARVVALGDSVTFGIRLAPDVLWPKLLEGAYAEEGRAVEVLNLGIVGYDVFEEVALLAKSGVAFDPDLVVVGFHVNDLGYASPTRDYIQRLQTYGSPLYRIRTLQLLRTRLDQLQMSREHMRRDDEGVFRLENADRIVDVSADAELAGRLESLRAGFETEGMDAGLHRYLRWYGSEPRIGKLRHSLERLAALAEEHGFQTLVFLVPWLGDGGCEELYDQAYALVGREVERVGLNWLNPVAATRAAGHLDLRITNGDYGHPNEEGHRILMRAVQAHIAESGLLP